jgi:4a-hydroxytetrahydrobiopterin dehydratase
MWQESQDKLKKSFTFKDFKTAFAFMTEVARVAEELDHHPWWSNLYNKVNFELYTFDAGDKVTHRDHKLAATVDEIAAKYLAIA